jgi:septum formation protein
LLRQIGVQFQQFSVDVPEQHTPGESPEAYVTRLAKDKAQAGWQYIERKGMAHQPVLGSDTVVVCDQHILEKPRDLQHAIEILSMLSGRSHSVLSAVAVVDASRCEFSVSLTDVTFKAFSRAEIERYWATGEPADKAGAYGIQGLGAVFVDAISGSYSNVVGLPLEKTVQLLARFDINYWQ